MSSTNPMADMLKYVGAAIHAGALAKEKKAGAGKGKPSTAKPGSHPKVDLKGITVDSPQSQPQGQVDIGTPTIESSMPDAPPAPRTTAEIGPIEVQGGTTDLNRSSVELPLREFYRLIKGNPKYAEKVLPGITDLKKAFKQDLIKAGPDGSPMVTINVKALSMLAAHAYGKTALVADPQKFDPEQMHKGVSPYKPLSQEGMLIAQQAGIDPSELAPSPAGPSYDRVNRQATDVEL